jgi:hypothetical protein
VFHVRDAVAAGASPDGLRRVGLRAPYRGVRASTTAPADFVGRCLEYAPRLAPGQFFSHETALVLLGVPAPDLPYRPAVHVSSHRPAYPPRIAGIHGHRLQTRDAAIRLSPGGLTVEHPVRAWRQTGTLWRLDDLIAAADHLISGDTPLASVDELLEEIRLMGDVRHGMLRRALLETRMGPRSPKETQLRLLLVRAGLPEPEVSWVLRDVHGRRVAELDLAYPRWRVGPEYDGRVHADDDRQFARDADRWAAIRALGWDHVRVLKHHLRGDGRAAVALVREALERAGWRPGL